MRMHLREDLQLTKTMLTIFVVFLVTFLPAVVSNVLESKLPFPILHLVASILSWTSAVINPLVYSLLHHQYKEVSKLELISLMVCRLSAAQCAGAAAPPQHLWRLQLAVLTACWI